MLSIATQTNSAFEMSRFKKMTHRTRKTNQYAQTTVPNNIKEDSLPDYLIDNEHLYVDKIDEAMHKATYEYGFGTDADANSHYNSCMNEPDSESEWRYECDELKTGGHL